LYALLLLVDVALSGESIYQFSTADLLLNVHYLPALDSPQMYAIAGVVLLFLAAFVKLSGQGRPGGAAHDAAGRARVTVLAGFVGVALAAAGAGLDVFAHPFDATKSVRLVGSRTLEVGESGLALALGPEWTRKMYAESDWRGRVALRDISRTKGARPYHLVLVVVESEGVLRNRADHERVFGPLTDKAIAQRYAVAQGTLPFKGPTVSGELRALCGIQGSPATVETGQKLPDCLPRQLRSVGYETLSFHGNTESLFERTRWYPDLGFDLSYFEETLSLKGAGATRECGVLIRGICDSEMIRFVQRELEHPGRRPKFIYWLTLSSHLPVDTVLARDSEFDCSASASLKEEPGPCAHERILHRVHQQIAQVVLDPALPPTRFIIVGDHAPPFLEVAERALYSPDRVPYVDLVPLSAL
jgi:hypothetical protein